MTTTYFLNEAQTNGNVIHWDNMSLNEAREAFDALVAETREYDGDTSYVQRIDVFRHITPEEEEQGIDQWDLDPEYSYTHNG